MNVELIKICSTTVNAVGSVYVELKLLVGGVAASNVWKVLLQFVFVGVRLRNAIRVDDVE